MKLWWRFGPLTNASDCWRFSNLKSLVICSYGLRCFDPDSDSVPTMDIWCAKSVNWQTKNTQLKSDILCPGEKWLKSCSKSSFWVTLHGDPNPKSLSSCVFSLWICFGVCRATSRGGTNRVFGKPCFCPLPKRGRFDENGENDEFAFYPLKQGFRSSDPQKRRKWRKWRVSLRKRHGLEKTWFVLPWTSGSQP